MALQKTRIGDLRGLLSELGLGRGQVVMAHTAVFTLGHMENGLAGLYRAFLDVLGHEGTLVVPTFTWSFRRNEVFDVCNTPAPPVLGAFSEFIRNQPGAVRSPCPLFSMAAIGPEAEPLMGREGHACFGPGSIYQRLFARDVWFVGLGITYSTGLSAFMHLEREANVDYRIDMRFDGQSRDRHGRLYADYAIHFARHQQAFPSGYTNRDPLGRGMEAAGISKAVAFASGRHFAMRARPFSDYVLEALAVDPHAMFIPARVDTDAS